MFRPMACCFFSIRSLGHVLLWSPTRALPNCGVHPPENLRPQGDRHPQRHWGMMERSASFLQCRFSLRGNDVNRLIFNCGFSVVNRQRVPRDYFLQGALSEYGSSHRVWARLSNGTPVHGQCKRLRRALFWHMAIRVTLFC